MVLSWIVPVPQPVPLGFYTCEPLWFCNAVTQQPGAQDTTGNVFIDNTYSGGAGPDNIGLTSSAGNTFGYTLPHRFPVLWAPPLLLSKALQDLSLP